MLKDLLAELGVDVLVLNETMRPSKKPWPMVSRTCRPVLLKPPRSSQAKDAVLLLEVLEPDNVLGTKVVLRVNDFVLFCLYCPTPGI